MERRAFLRAVGPAAVAGLAGCIGGSSGNQEYDVGMSARAYRPPQLTVEPGTTVRWLNTSKQGHTVTAYEGQLPEDAEFFASGDFESEADAREAWGNSNRGTLFEGQAYEYTFEVEGTYPYFCIPHERGGMVGTVVVSE
jgi:plastocyanin